MVEFQPGFRLSNLDVLVILFGTIAAIYFYNVSVLLSLIIIFVLAHFFLFCNIARMSRQPELIWASSFVCLSVASIQFSLFPIYLVFLISTCETVLLVLLETKKPSYHGVLWQKFNPKLQTWFADNVQENI